MRVSLPVCGVAAVSTQSARAGTQKSLARTGLLFVEGEALPVLLLELLELLVDDELLVRGKALPHRLDVRERDDGRRGRRGRSRAVRGARRGGECAGRGAEGETRTRQAEGLHGDDGGDEEEE